MAGRIRSVKPEFIEDEKLGELDPLHRLLFLCLWLIADDYGNLRANPKWVHAQVFPYDEKTDVGAIRDALATLTRLGFLDSYSVRGQSYYHVHNWDKHQKVDRPGKRHCPAYEDREIDENFNDVGVIREGHARATRGPRGNDATDLDQEGDQEREREIARASQTKNQTHIQNFKSSFADPTRAPDSLEFDVESIEFCKRHALDIKEEWESCRDYRRGRGETREDWNAEFRSWLKKARNFKSKKEEEKPVRRGIDAKAAGLPGY